MTTKEFYMNIGKEPRLKALGLTEDGIAIIESTVGGYKTYIELSGLAGLTWETILPILLGTREPKCIKHLTRIVGYYSHVENWNESKVAELDDRRKGDYGIKP